MVVIYNILSFGVGRWGVITILFESQRRMIERHSHAVETKRSQPVSTNRDVYKSSYESSRLVYDLRKEVLDKLDIILQKVNLSVLKCLDSGSKSIKLISMTELEEEI